MIQSTDTGLAPLPDGTLIDGKDSGATLCRVTLYGKPCEPYIALTGPAGWVIVAVRLRVFDGMPTVKTAQDLADKLKAAPLSYIHLAACRFPDEQVWLADPSVVGSEVTGLVMTLVRGTVRAFAPVAMLSRFRRLGPG